MKNADASDSSKVTGVTETLGAQLWDPSKCALVVWMSVTETPPRGAYKLTTSLFFSRQVNRSEEVRRRFIRS